MHKALLRALHPQASAEALARLLGESECAGDCGACQLWKTPPPPPQRERYDTLGDLPDDARASLSALYAHLFGPVAQQRFALFALAGERPNANQGRWGPAIVGAGDVEWRVRIAPRGRAAAPLATNERRTIAWLIRCAAGVRVVRFELALLPDLGATGSAATAHAPLCSPLGVNMLGISIHDVGPPEGRIAWGVALELVGMDESSVHVRPGMGCHAIAGALLGYMTTPSPQMGGGVDAIGVLQHTCLLDALNARLAAGCADDTKDPIALLRASERLAELGSLAGMVDALADAAASTGEDALPGGLADKLAAWPTLIALTARVAAFPPRFGIEAQASPEACALSLLVAPELDEKHTTATDRLLMRACATLRTDAGRAGRGEPACSCPPLEIVNGALGISLATLYHAGESLSTSVCGRVEVVGGGPNWGDARQCEDRVSAACVRKRASEPAGFRRASRGARQHVVVRLAREVEASLRAAEDTGATGTALTAPELAALLAEGVGLGATRHYGVAAAIVSDRSPLRPCATCGRLVPGPAAALLRLAGPGPPPPQTRCLRCAQQAPKAWELHEEKS